MQWKGRRQSTNVDDRRRASGGQMALGGGIGAIIITLIGLFLGGQFGGNIFGDSGISVPSGGLGGGGSSAGIVVDLTERRKSRPATGGAVSGLAPKACR